MAGPDKAARDLLDSVVSRWRVDASNNAHDLLTRLGLVTREEFEELELRLAQLEHRLRLLETPPTAQD